MKTSEDKNVKFKYLFLEYPKCSTCLKAKKWLDDNEIGYEDRHIVEDNPSVQELTQWIKRSGFPIKKFFNFCGMLYKQMNLKDRLSSMSELEQIEILSTNGMLVKRPLIIADDFVLIGFKEKEWKRLKM